VVRGSPLGGFAPQNDGGWCNPTTYVILRCERRKDASLEGRAAPAIVTSLHKDEVTAGRLFDGLAVVVLALVTLVAALTFRDYGLGWDDYTHAEMGELLLAFYSSGFTDRRALSFVNLYMYGGGFDMLAALLDKIVPFDLFESRRLLGAIVGVVGLAITWRLARRIAGPLAGLLALAFLATCPLYYGHMFMNPKDAPFAVATTLFLFAAIRAVETYPSPPLRTVLLLGFSFGLTIGSRIMGGIVAFPAALGIALLLVFDGQALGVRPALRRLGRFLLLLIPGAALGYLIMGLVWPWSVIDPLNPFRAIAYFSHFFEKPWKEMFAGSLIAVPEMPIVYLPTLLLLKLPEIMTFCALCGLGLSLWRAADRNANGRSRASHLILAGALLVPIVATVITRPALYNGVRHFLFLLPPMAVLAGLFAAWAIQKLAERVRPLAIVAGAVVLVGLVSPVAEMVRLHPYQYTHFNRVAGGIRAADEQYMLDYWGLAFKQAAQELRAKLTEQIETPTDGRRWKIAVCGPHRPASVELGPEFDTTWDSKGADFALTLGEFYCRELNAPILVEIKRDGVVFARAYDIRGRTVTTLLTMPPP
jgi:hypothetical protein